jgi:hypothetical protein
MYFDTARIKENFDTKELAKLRKELIAESDKDDGFSFINTAVFSVLTDIVDHIGDLISLEDTDILRRDELQNTIYRNLFFAQTLLVDDKEKQVSKLYKQALKDINTKLVDCENTAADFGVSIKRSSVENQDLFAAGLVLFRESDAPLFSATKEFSAFDEQGFVNVLYDFLISFEALGNRIDDDVKIIFHLTDDEAEFDRVHLYSAKGVLYAEDEYQKDFETSIAQLMSDYLVNNKALAKELKEFVREHSKNGQLLLMFNYQRQSPSAVEFVEEEDWQ